MLPIMLCEHVELLDLNCAMALLRLCRICDRMCAFLETNLQPDMTWTAPLHCPGR
jgi:hypothetical protein